MEKSTYKKMKVTLILFLFLTNEILTTPVDWIGVKMTGTEVSSGRILKNTGPDRYIVWGIQNEAYIVKINLDAAPRAVLHRSITLTGESTASSGTFITFEGSLNAIMVSRIGRMVSADLAVNWGTYSIPDREWSNTREEIKGTTYGIVSVAENVAPLSAYRMDGNNPASVQQFDIGAPASVNVFLKGTSNFIVLHDDAATPGKIFDYTMNDAGNAISPLSTFTKPYTGAEEIGHCPDDGNNLVVVGIGNTLMKTFYHVNNTLLLERTFSSSNGVLTAMDYIEGSRLMVFASTGTQLIIASHTSDGDTPIYTTVSQNVKQISFFEGTRIMLITSTTDRNVRLYKVPEVPCTDQLADTCNDTYQSQMLTCKENATPNSSGICECNPGYLPTGCTNPTSIDVCVEQCWIQCHSSCLQYNCNLPNDENKCTACASTDYIIEGGGLEGKCILDCDPSCVTCNAARDNTKCLTCVSGSQVSNGIGNEGQCLLCHSSCVECSFPLDESKCIQCPVDYKIEGGLLEGKCVLDCDNSCLQCSAAKDSTKCITCPNKFVLEEGGVQGVGKCLPCHETCGSGCSLKEDKNKCFDCISGLDFQEISNGEGFCYIPCKEEEGEYLVDGVCVKCVLEPEKCNKILRLYSTKIVLEDDISFVDLIFNMDLRGIMDEKSYEQFPYSEYINIKRILSKKFIKFI